MTVTILTSCSDGKKSLPMEQETPSLDNVCYIAIDIDDIFQPNWDSKKNAVGDIKMNRSDVNVLEELSETINECFPSSDFMFTMGYNSGYYEADNDGDRAFLEHASSFLWFNHLPRHEHIESNKYTAWEIISLLDEGSAFAVEHGFDPYITDYIVTPRHEGIWPPYDPLYEALNYIGISTTSTQLVSRPAMYGGVKIVPRIFIGITSGDYSYNQISEKKIGEISKKLFVRLQNESYAVIYSHQANFARDRLGNRLIETLLTLLESDTDRTYIFRSAYDVVNLWHESL